MTGDRPQDETVQALGHAVRTGDLSLVERFLADEVLWYGEGPGGGCRSREDVLDTLRGQLDQGIRGRVHELRRVGDRVLLRVELSLDEEERGDRDQTLWFVLTLDAAGRIVELQDYSSEAAAEYDLSIRSDAAAAAGEHDPAPPRVPVSNLVPFAHVADVERSVAFYRLLGFATRHTYEPDGRLVWAFMENERAALMLARAEAPIRAREQAVLFYLYARDLVGLRDHLVAHGVTPGPGEITDGSPGPRQEMRVTDPDGYCLMIAQIDEESLH
ncbi:MAG: VOC family protein [Solirubrobacteraceae bacterium]